MLKTKFVVDPEVYWLVCVCILLLPLKFCAAWFISVCVHEYSHYIALRLTGNKVQSVRIGLYGAKIKTQQLSIASELICSAAGPAGGLLLMVLLKVFPLLSIVSLLHSIFNLLPLYPLDGGRVVHCLLYRFLKNSTNAVRYFDICIIVILLSFSIFFSYYFSLGALPVIIAVSLVARNRKKIILQT